jgi:hypothetical protein
MSDAGWSPARFVDRLATPPSGGASVTPDRPAIYLHIGAMKTGTTFVQHKLIANRAALDRAGIVFPGRIWGQQVRAVQEVLRLDRRDPRLREEARGAWQATADEMLAHSGTSVLSMEFLGAARHRHARRVVGSLARADVDVVLTVRDTAAIIPAQWQTGVRNGSQVSWPDYMRGVRSAHGLRARWGRYLPDAALRSFLRAADIPRMLRVWGRVVPSDRMHVVTVPPPGSDPDLLWQRFAAAVGLDPAICPLPPAQTNASLGFASVELLRQVNQKLGRQRETDYHGTVKNFLALEVLAARRGLETPARLDLATWDFSVGWNHRVREAITASGAHLVGDLDDLPLSAGDAPCGSDAAPEQHQILDAAAFAVEAMDRLVRRRIRRCRQRGEPVAFPQGGPLVATRDRWADAPDPVVAAAEEIAELCLVAMEHRRCQLTGPGRLRRTRGG